MRGVPLPGKWSRGGFWHADDLSYSRGQEVLLWAPREGAVSWVGTTGATCPTMSRTGYMGRKAVRFSAANNQRMRADALASLQDGTDLPISIWAAIQPTSTTNGAIVAFTAPASTPYHLFYLNASGNPACIRDAAPSAAFGCPAVQNGRQAVCQVFDGTSSIFYNDKKESAPIAQDRAAALTVSQVVLGNFFRTSASTSFDGLMRAVGITDETLTPDDIEELYDFMFGTPRRVWLVGDSQVVGSDPGAQGLRRPLSDLISTRNFPVDLVGTLDTGTLWSRTRHDGHSGFNLQSVANVVAATLGPGLAVPDAQLVGVIAGTNNMGAGSTPYDPVLTPAEYENLINLIHARAPDAMLWVTTIYPINPASFPAADANRIDFNSKLPPIWATYNAANPSSPALVSDAAVALGNAWAAPNYVDDFHLSATGNGLVFNDGLVGMRRVIQPGLV